MTRHIKHRTKNCNRVIGVSDGGENRLYTGEKVPDNVSMISVPCPNPDCVDEQGNRKIVHWKIEVWDKNEK